MAEHYSGGPEWLLPLLWVLAIDPELGQQPQDESSERGSLVRCSVRWRSGAPKALQLKALAHGLLGHAVKLCSAFGVLDRSGRSSEPEILALLSFHNTPPASGRAGRRLLLRFILLAISPPPCSEVYTLHELRIEWSHSRCRRLRDASAVREMPADALARQAAAREAKTYQHTHQPSTMIWYQNRMRFFVFWCGIRVLHGTSGYP